VNVKTLKQEEVAMSSLKKDEKYAKNIGIIKEIDNVGRIVVPKEFRERLGLENYVEMVLTSDGVLIRNSQYELVRKIGE